MDARQSFKLGFMSACIEQGYTTPEEMLGILKTALDKQSSGGGTGPLGTVTALMLGEGAGKVMDAGGAAIKTIGEWGIPAAALAPPIIGAGLGTLASKANDTSDFDVDEAKKQEVIDEYRRQGDRVRREGMLRRFAMPQRGGYRSSSLL